MKYNLEVEIKNIEVSDNYYSFDYICKLDGKKYKSDNYESDFDNWTNSKFKKYLIDKGALEIVFTQIGE